MHDETYGEEDGESMPVTTRGVMDLLVSLQVEKLQAHFSEESGLTGVVQDEWHADMNLAVALVEKRAELLRATGAED